MRKFAHNLWAPPPGGAPITHSTRMYFLPFSANIEILHFLPGVFFVVQDPSEIFGNFFIMVRNSL